jgi:hypothetical protein
MSPSTTLPANPFKGRGEESIQIIGIATPSEIPVPEGMTPQQMVALDKLSKQLFVGLQSYRDAFLKSYPKLNFVEKTYVVVDSSSALIADWSCSQEAANSSPFDIPTSVASSVEILYHNYMQKQKELHDRFGRFVH